MGRYVQIMTSRQKALQINSEPSIYGAFAEIGAGQEVVRHFFQAGGAAQTIAKTISAYDMAMSDAIYGKEPSGRYVCENRLLKMLDREYSILISRLEGTRPANTKYFAFANTVTTGNHGNTGHGHVGVRFQHLPGGEASDVLVHVTMLDNGPVLQQEALGVLGVNLIHACFFHAENPDSLTQSLMDNLTTTRMKIDMIRVQGPAFLGIDPRLLNLGLIKRDFSDGVMFDKNGEVLRPAEVLYRKNLLVLRGSFRPPTLLNLDMLKKGEQCFNEDLPDNEKSQSISLCEISMHELLERGEVRDDDFLTRVDLLSALGQNVLISNKETLWALNSYLAPMGKMKVAYIVSPYNVEALLNVEGALSVLGKTVGEQGRLYVYPTRDEKTGEFLNLANCRVSEKARSLLNYLTAMKFMVDIQHYEDKYLKIWSRTVLKLIEKNDPEWESMVPEVVAKTVKRKGLFGFKKA